MSVWVCTQNRGGDTPPTFSYHGWVYCPKFGRTDFFIFCKSYKKYLHLSAIPPLPQVQILLCKLELQPYSFKRESPLAEQEPELIIGHEEDNVDEKVDLESVFGNSILGFLILISILIS